MPAWLKSKAQIRHSHINHGQSQDYDDKNLHLNRLIPEEKMDEYKELLLSQTNDPELVDKIIEKHKREQFNIKSQAKERAPEIAKKKSGRQQRLLANRVEKQRKQDLGFNI